MRIPRIFQSTEIHLNSKIELNEEASRHINTVLRLKIGDSIYLFNGNGNDYLAEIIDYKKNSLKVVVNDQITTQRESALFIHLGQVISKGERMDWVVQKSTELGVAKITPLFSERCIVQLKGDRVEKRQEHWQKIAISACEQSTRNIIPEITKPIDMKEWILNIPKNNKAIKLILHPFAQDSLVNILQHSSEKTVSDKDNEKVETKEILLLIGPEGGLTVAENDFAIHKGFLPVKMGPRILRTETAALAAITILQCQFGDMGI